MTIFGYENISEAHLLPTILFINQQLILREMSFLGKYAIQDDFPTFVVVENN